MTQIKPGIIYSFIIYIAAALLMWVQTHFTISRLSENTSIEPILFWFIVGGLGIFFPLIVTAILILKSENLKLNADTWQGRMRFAKMNTRDWKWIAAGVFATGIASAFIMLIIYLVKGNLDYTPTFMEFEPLNSGRYWILAVWFIFWLLNIMGEEILWRGVMQPRQEIIFGNKTWIVQGLGWSLFHLVFGWQLWLMLLPLMFIQPYIVQKTRNSWVGVAIHGIVNGPSFVAIAFGVI